MRTRALATLTRVPPVLRLLLALAAAVAGVAVGTVGSFLHPLRLIALPVGLVVGLVLSTAVVVAAGSLAGTRAAALGAAAGWLGAVLVMSARRPEGDLVVAGSLLGYAWLLAGVVTVGAAVALPYDRLRRPSARP